MTGQRACEGVGGMGTLKDALATVGNGTLPRYTGWPEQAPDPAVTSGFTVRPSAMPK